MSPSKLTLVLACLLVLAPANGQDQALTNQAIVKMVQSGLGDALIVSMVKTQPGTYSVTADDVIKLKDERVSDAIIAAMLAKGSGIASSSLNSAETRLSGPVKGIVLAGASNNPKHIQDVLDGLKDRFAAAKVSVTLVEKSRADILDQIKTSGGSLLWITVDIAAGQLKDKVKVQFYDASGSKVWEEEASGGLMNFSGSGATKNMIKNIYNKIEPHLKEK